MHRWMSLVREAFRLALKRLGRAPMTALPPVLVVALTTLALAVVLSLVRGVLFKPLPYPDPERLVHVGWQTHPGHDSPMNLTVQQDHQMPFGGACLHQRLARLELAQLGRLEQSRPIGVIQLAEKLVVRRHALERLGRTGADHLARAIRKEQTLALDLQRDEGQAGQRLRGAGEATLAEVDDAVEGAWAQFGQLGLVAMNRWRPTLGAVRCPG